MTAQRNCFVIVVPYVHVQCVRRRRFQTVRGQTYFVPLLPHFVQASDVVQIFAHVKRTVAAALNVDVSKCYGATVFLHVLGIWRGRHVGEYCATDFVRICYCNCGFGLFLIISTSLILTCIVFVFGIVVVLRLRFFCIFLGCIAAGG